MTQVSAITAVWHPEPGEGAGQGGRYALAPDVVLVIVEDATSRLLDMGGRFYGMPALSTAMLTGALRDGSDEAARRLADEYGVPTERVRADLDRFLGDLAVRGLVIAPGARVCRSLRAGDLAAGAVLLAARAARRALRPWPTAWAWALVTLARLSLRALGWARTVTIVRTLGTPEPGAGARGDWADAVARTDELVRAIAARHVLMLECKERAMGCWALLRSAGWPAELVVGVDLFPFLGHCWCESGAWTVSDDRSRCERFVPVIRYA
jgi:hypothetical protein